MSDIASKVRSTTVRAARPQGLAHVAGAHYLAELLGLRARGLRSAALMAAEVAEKTVGEAGFEPTTSSSQSWRTTRLCYSPSFDAGLGPVEAIGLSAGDEECASVESLKNATFHIGADENGLGPRLGPMVVTAVLAKVTPTGRGLLHPDAKSDLDSRLDDSKKLVAFGDCALAEAWTRALVERGAGRHNHCETPDELLDAVCIDTRAELQRPCPTHVLSQCWRTDGDAFDARASGLLPTVARDLDELALGGVDILAVRSVVVCNHRLNEAAEAGKSRFKVDLNAMERLVLALRELAGGEVNAVCGKVGGYAHYEEAFGPLAGRLHTVLEESRVRSAYRFPGLGELSFAMDADANHRLVALASLVGKYVRELSMSRIVHHYRRDDASLPLVSGYHDPVTARFVAGTQARRSDENVPNTCFERTKRGPPR